MKLEIIRHYPRFCFGVGPWLISLNDSGREEKEINLGWFTLRISRGNNF